MAFQLSPGVLVNERDLTSIIPAVATSTGGFAGTFVWGPVMDPTTISSENQLVARFGKPTDGNAASFFTAANFLSYTSNLILVRADVAGARNAVATPSGTVTGVTIQDGGEGYTGPIVTFSAPDVAGGTRATGTATRADGVITAIVITNPGSGYTSAPVITVVDPDGVDFAGTPAVTVGGVKINNEDDYNTNFSNETGLVGPWAAKYPGALGNSLRVEIADAEIFNATQTVEGVTSFVFPYRGEFDSAPGTSSYAQAAGATNDEIHIVVVDKDGAWTGTRGAILEKFAYVSKASDSKKSDGTNNYYADVVNANSRYIWWTDHPANTVVGGALWGTPTVPGGTFRDLDPDTRTGQSSASLSGGVDDLASNDGDIQDAYALLQNAELYDISLVPTGAVSATVAKYVIQNICEVRKDCIAFVSPVDDNGQMIMGVDAVEDTIAFRTDSAFNVNSSYGVLDSGWKYQYDRYNDKYRWVPLNGDIAGLCARTDYTNDAWWSPGGLNRGQIKNVIKLNINPNKTDRDNLYKAGINPVVSFPGQGTVLFGDKTLLAKPSAFDRINVRRLFIVLEKAIATAAQYQLFEFNDSFTRAQFRSLVEPFLRDVQGRRGVTDFRVKCDETNNTGEVIDRNEFIADIFIKPNRSINFITLNFIAARSGISFDEIGA
jgi:hypothetical protein